MAVEQGLEKRCFSLFEQRKMCNWIVFKRRLKTPLWIESPVSKDAAISKYCFFLCLINFNSADDCL